MFHFFCYNFQTLIFLLLWIPIILDGNSSSSFLSFQLIVNNKGIKMRIILLSLMMVCLFDYHVNCISCISEPCLVSIQNTYQYNPDRILIELLLQEIESTHCHGFAEIRSEFNGTETLHGTMTVNEGDSLPKNASKLRYRSMPGGRAANKIIEVQGNCCWTFYER